jgi:hypothetical protein
MHKTKSNKKNKKIKQQKLLSEEFELPISLEELAMYVIGEGEPNTEIVNVLHNEPEKVNEVVKNILIELEEIKNWKVSIISVKFNYYGSINITHGVAYFSVCLKGTRESLKKVSRSDWPFTKKDE